MLTIAHLGRLDDAVAAGYQRFLADGRPWRIVPFQVPGDVIGELLRLRPDGVVGSIGQTKPAERLIRAGIPAVNTSGSCATSPVPRVQVDNRRCGVLAAEHLLGCGFTRFASLGQRGFPWSDLRESGFAAALAAGGRRVMSYPENLLLEDPISRWRTARESRRLSTWLAAQERPLALFCANAALALLAAEAARLAGLRIPEELALIAVGEGPAIRLTCPPITCVTRPLERIAFTTLCALDDLLAGRQPPAEQLLEPLGISAQGSTDLASTTDRPAADAMRFIRENYHRGIGVGEVVAAAHLSRRALEERFRRIFGRTIHDEIVRLRIERVRQLLAETDLKLDAIARQTGHGNGRWLITAFRKAVGASPMAYRARHQGRPG